MAPRNVRAQLLFKRCTYMIQQGSIKIHPVEISSGILCEMNTRTRFPWMIHEENLAFKLDKSSSIEVKTLRCPINFTLENLHRTFLSMDQYTNTAALADVTYIPEILVIVIVIYVQYKTFVRVSFFHCRQSK